MEQAKAFIKNIGWYNVFLCVIVGFGVFLRLKGYLTNSSLWHDECALAWNLKSKSFSGLFGPLEFMQMSPPFFLVSTKMLTKIFGFSEYVLRLLPFVIGCVSLFAFYVLSRKVLKSNVGVIVAMFLFCFNTNLINYSFEFKPYGFDVFFAILVLLFFMDLDLEKFSLKKSLASGTIMAVVPWFSFVSIFVLAGGYLNLFFKSLGENKCIDVVKKLVCLTLPVLLSGFCYLKFYLASASVKGQMNLFWNDYFINSGFKHFMWLLTSNIAYFFTTKYIIFILVLFIWGLILLAKEKSEFVRISFFTFLIFFACSFLKFYPFAERLILFMFPIFLLFVLKPLDLVSADKKVVSILISIFVFWTFCPQLFNAQSLVAAKGFDKGEFAREMMQSMMQKIKPNDTIIVNNPSDAEFVYYSSFYKFKNKVIQEKLDVASKDEYLVFLNKLPSGKYWFYFPIDFVTNQVGNFVRQWSQDKVIIYKEYDFPRSILLYVEN